MCQSLLRYGQHGCQLAGDIPLGANAIQENSGFTLQYTPKAGEE